MNRSRLINTLLGLILFACAGVIYADQKGSFSGSVIPPVPTNTSAPVGNPADRTPDAAPAPQPANNSGYGSVK